MIDKDIISDFKRPCQRFDHMQIWHGADMIAIDMEYMFDETNQLTARNCSDRCLDNKECNSFSYDPDQTTCLLATKPVRGVNAYNMSPENPNLISGMRCSFENLQDVPRPADEEYSKGKMLNFPQIELSEKLIFFLNKIYYFNN